MERDHSSRAFSVDSSQLELQYRIWILTEIRTTRPAGGEVVWSWHAWDHLVQNFDPAAPAFAMPASRPERIDINGDRNPDPPSEEEENAEREQMAAL